MKLLVDECLSPRYVAALRERGYPDSVHPAFRWIEGVSDQEVLDLALAEHRVIITANGRDFLRLMSALPTHPGLIIIADVNRLRGWGLIEAALTHIERDPSPPDYMTDRIIDIAADGTIEAYRLTSDRRD